MNTFKHSAGCISEVYKNIQKPPYSDLGQYFSCLDIAGAP